MTPKTPHEIVGGVNRKEDWALELVWKMYAPFVNSLILGIMGRTYHNEDLAQDVSVILLKTKVHLPSQNHIKRFLNQVTKHVCLDKQKKINTERKHEDPLIDHYRSMEEDDIEIAESKAYRLLVIHQEISKIPGKCGRVFHMHEILELSDSEIALQLGISGKTVDNLLSEARRFLKMDSAETRRRYAYPLIILLLIYLYESL